MSRPRIEGWFASDNPRANVLAGPDAIVAGDPDGLAVARFGWANMTTGRALNARNLSDDVQGWVLPTWGGWNRVYVSLGQRFVRPGLPVTLCTRGDFWARFDGGAIAGDRVYANLLDGSAISGYAINAEETPYTVEVGCAPGNLAIITTWSNYR